MTGFAGVVPLIRFALRRDRVFLVVWILAIVSITYASAAAVRRTYDTPQEIASYALNMGASPAGVAMAGPPVALDRIGGILIYETSLTALLGVALMALFTVVRHTRREEDAGRVELLGSTVVSPHAIITAAILVASSASVLIGAGVTLSFLAEAQPVPESILYGASVAAFGVVFTGVAACASQVMSHARGAVGLSLAVLGLAFGLRAIGDVQGSVWSWLSPMGWSQQVQVYAANRWWPLGLSLALTALLILGTVLSESRRDLGAGLVVGRPGPASAGRALSGVVGITWRLQRGSVLGWAAGLFTMGALLGSFSESIQNMVKDNPTLARYFLRSGMDVVDAYFATSLLLLAIGASGFTVSSALRTRAEETAGRLEPILATAVSRTRWLLGALLVTLVGTVLVVAAGGFGVGLAYAMTAGSATDIATLTGYAVVYLPPVLVLGAIVVLLVGWLPRSATAAWGGVAFCFLVGWLGSLLNPPQWLRDLSPFTHVPAVPAADITAAPLATLLILSTAAVVTGWVGFRLRDIG